MNVETPHWGQIITTKKTIINFIWDIDHAVCYNTVLLIAMGANLPSYHLRLYSVCARLYYLSKLVYRGKNGVVKLPRKKYEEVFEGFAETKEEVVEILKQYNRNGKENVDINEQLADYTFRCLQLVKTMWCTFLACVHEQVYISEFAYALEYVIKNKGNLPMPEYQFSDLFPSNYKEFNYTEGIAAYYQDIMHGLF